MKFFIEKPHYVMSELKTADRYLLDIAEKVGHCIVSRDWIDDFRRFLIASQEKYIKANKRVKPVDFTPVREWTDWGTNEKCLRDISFCAGRISMTFIPVPAEYSSFFPEQVQLPWKSL